MLILFLSRFRNHHHLLNLLRYVIFSYCSLALFYPGKLSFVFLLLVTLLFIILFIIAMLHILMEGYFFAGILITRLKDCDEELVKVSCLTCCTFFASICSIVCSFMLSVSWLVSQSISIPYVPFISYNWTPFSFAILPCSSTQTSLQSIFYDAAISTQTVLPVHSNQH